MPAIRARHDADTLFAGFAAALRHSGIPVTADRTQTFLLACTTVGADERTGVFWAGRATLCSCQDDIDKYDKVFAAWFGGEATTGASVSPPPTKLLRAADLSDDEPAGSDEAGGEVRAMASTTEVLRHRDIADLSASERAELARMFAALSVRSPRRPAARRRPANRGEIDMRRTTREELRRAGEPGPVLHRRRTTRPRRLVLLIDVSGSMGPYADSLLRLGHVAARSGPRSTEIFTVGTRLTRITKALRQRDPETAIVAAGQTVPDWSGGTRLGEMVKVFLDRWGQRGMARGAVVVILSDGWERGDCTLLAESMSRLSRLAHRVIWVNPHSGKHGYQPVQGGMAAALPYVDEFMAGHSVATFEALMGVVARA
jgi:uncharacterized protein with von Willebrand factor type A (vWA) domain